MMRALHEIRENRSLVNDINWDMTPEEAVTLYLEWGNNWSHGKHLVRSKNDVSFYFVVNTWDDPPQIYLIRRNSDEAKELAKIEIPLPLRDRFLDEVGHNKGVYAINEEIRAWLEEALGLSPHASKPHTSKH
jgi:hypothetical protein